MGRHIDGFHCVHGEHDVGQRNLQGRMYVTTVMAGERIVCVKYVMLKRLREKGDI